jgi:hypothetical protein
MKGFCQSIFQTGASDFMKMIDRNVANHVIKIMNVRKRNNFSLKFLIRAFKDSLVWRLR